MKIFWIVVLTLLGVVQVIAMFGAWRATRYVGMPKCVRLVAIILWPLTLAALMLGSVQ